MHKEYRCSAREWEFARLFSIVTGSKRGAGRSPYKGCLTTIVIWVLLLGLYYVILFLSPSLAERVEWLKDSAILVGIVVGASLFFFSLFRSGTAFVMPKQGDVIRYVMLNEEGLLINIDNNEDPKVMPLVTWEGISRIQIDITKELRFYIGGKAYPIRHEQRIAALNARYPEHSPVPAADVYPDRFTIIVNKEKSPLSYTVIQIPPSWLHNGMLSNLLSEMEKYSRKKTQPYDEQAATYYQAWLKKR